jgi:hypothetical protein
MGAVAFWKVAMRPGRPFAFGPLRPSRPDGLAVCPARQPGGGLVTFYAFAREAIAACWPARSGRPAGTLSARSAVAIRKRPGRTEFQRGVVQRGADGQWEVHPTGSQGAGILRSMSEANALVVLGHDQGSVAAGERAGRGVAVRRAGVLPRPPASLPAPPPPTPRTLPLRARVPWAQAGGAVLAAALLVLVTVQGTRHVLNASPDLAPSVARSWSAGEQHDGDPLPARHPWLRPVVATAADTLPAVAASAPAAQPAASVDALTLRRGCVWGQPGRNPYRGTVEQALLHARLPAEVVTEIARKVKAHEISDRLEIRSAAVTDQMIENDAKSTGDVPELGHSAPRASATRR